MDLKSLADNLGLEPDEFNELAELFIETAEAELAALKDALAATNVEELAKTAHSLKGAAGNLGFSRIHELAQTVDANAKDNVLEGAAELIGNIDLELKRLNELLSRS